MGCPDNQITTEKLASCAKLFLDYTEGMTNQENQTQFMPFHAINEFMVDDYRFSVIQRVMASTADLSSAQRSSLTKLIKKYVRVSGFRNSAQAPAGLKARHAVKEFEKRPDFTARILAAWADLNSELARQVYGLLKSRQWELLPIEADRTQLPGFMTTWPKTETYDVLDAAFAEMYPQSPSDAVFQDDLRLMVVWVAGCLPYDLFLEDHEEEAEDAEPSR